jgi:hypothetical protein
MREGRAQPPVEPAQARTQNADDHHVLVGLAQELDPAKRDRDGRRFGRDPLHDIAAILQAVEDRDMRLVLKAILGQVLGGDVEPAPSQD